ncbi:MAG TPA: substrate-binding domain-containing protein [Candidatus Dormibacteraeota bacterium]|nr:substrate-binding domain-containing protein [Candidatus Dormibacteraeota bacterium]
MLVALLAGAVTLQPQATDHSAGWFPSYTSEQQVSGVIRIWGHGSRQKEFVGALVKSWEEGFRKHQPGIRFDTQLLGNSSAMGGLYTGATDIALLGREILPTEVDGYQQALGYQPFAVSVMTSGLDARNRDFALAILVHKENPLAHITLAQLDAIFGADGRRSAAKGADIHTWGELGLSGDWADKEIQLYGLDIASDFSQFLQGRVMAGSRKWNCKLHEFHDVKAPPSSDSRMVEAGQRILNALAEDRYGIAFSGAGYKHPRTKPLALAQSEDGPFYEASRETVSERTYPLARPVSIFVNRGHGQPIDPKVKEFLSYLLSREGQQAVLRESGYVPLTPDLAQGERRKIQ